MPGLSRERHRRCPRSRRSSVVLSTSMEAMLRAPLISSNMYCCMVEGRPVWGRTSPKKDAASTAASHARQSWDGASSRRRRAPRLRLRLWLRAGKATNCWAKPGLASCHVAATSISGRLHLASSQSSVKRLSQELYQGSIFLGRVLKQSNTYQSSRE
jgi:hypothetical protein